MTAWLKSVILALLAVALVAIASAIGYLAALLVASKPRPGYAVAIDPVSLLRHLFTPWVASVGVALFTPVSLAYPPLQDSLSVWVAHPFGGWPTPF